MPNEGILKAEQRVREMNRVTQQYAEQGSRYMRNMRQRNANRQSSPVPDSGTRFEPAVPPLKNSGQVAGQPPANGSPIRGETDRQNGSSRDTRNMHKNMQEHRDTRNNRQPQNMNVPAAPPPISEPRNEPPREQNVPAPPRCEKDTADPSDIFSGLGIDSEQLMLIALMYLLIREKADLKIILALGYLIL